MCLPPLSLGLLTPPGVFSCHWRFDWKPWHPCPRDRLLIRLTPHHLISIKTRLERSQHKARAGSTSATACQQSAICQGRAVASDCPKRRVVGGDFFFLAMCAAYARYQARVSKNDGSQRLLSVSFMYKFTRAQSRDWHFAGSILPTTHEATTWAILVRHDTRRRWKPLSSFW
ncbi:hypothetical protein M431DRAFT_491250 [Trichoderma harzianum CBS 226.95]|jgi:hypothetical protein|uniref:Uncharacterized protein n=1 Tax=Trichoderma harzianum CBS 226.95 TaxID=983964 RepID=A0A2T4ARG5_TRIHA|nr:hypothetical protein M431DRAFT_491250 [Trichoderma harzianum CBS 226.95]PTB59639.1 hypothetical protein M431DRAFT_491250 [Trichoderma harzianum CBS 226.95]